MRHRNGFTYPGMLLFVAITAAALAALGQSWSQAAQRERERELEFRGNEIARAIASYVRAAPQSANPAAVYPLSFDDLLVDRRALNARHHLRRLYADPFTGAADWVLVPAPVGSGFVGVRSRSERPLLRIHGPGGEELAQAADWQFVATEHLQGRAMRANESRPGG